MYCHIFLQNCCNNFNSHQHRMRLSIFCTIAKFSSLTIFNNDLKIFFSSLIFFSLNERILRKENMINKNQFSLPNKLGRHEQWKGGALAKLLGRNQLFYNVPGYYFHSQLRSQNQRIVCVMCVYHYLHQRRISLIITC